MLVCGVRCPLHNAGDHLPGRSIVPRVLIAALPISRRAIPIRIRQRVRRDRDAKSRIFGRELKDGLSREDVNHANRRRVTPKREVRMPKINRGAGGALVARNVRGGDVA